MDVGFVILCPDRNVGGLRNTLGSVTHHSYNRESICVVGEDATAAELKELKQHCETHKGANTITSLINVGMKKIKHEWAFIVFSGSRIQPYLERKIETFAKNDTDVLFPVVDRKCNFIDGSFNGVLFNKKFFAKVGEFVTADMQKQGLNDFELAKMFWAVDAIGHGCTFKAIVGMRVI
jgi:hypothetical protein